MDRLAYERAVEEQKMRIEVGAARKEAHHFRDLADKADGDKRTINKGKDVNRKEWQFYQKQTEDEIKQVIERKEERREGGEEDGDAGRRKKKGKRKLGRETEESNNNVKGGNNNNVKGAAPGVGEEKRRKKEIQEEKKTKKRELIKSIFHGGESDGE